MALRTLRPEKLKVGALYQVLKPLQQLQAGEVVCCLGLDDIDNHYGEYLFETEAGSPRKVTGDCSNPDSNPLRKVRQHLLRK